MIENITFQVTPETDPAAGYADMLPNNTLPRRSERQRRKPDRYGVTVDMKKMVNYGNTYVN